METNYVRVLPVNGENPHDTKKDFVYSNKD